MAPVIETARLRLRGHRSDDLSQCAAMWSDPNVTRFITGRASTEQQTWARVLSYIGHWSIVGFGYWVVEEKESGAFVGEAGFADFKRSGVPWSPGTPELGFALASQFHRKGYATEAVAAVLAWGDAHLASPNTACLINPQNTVSRRIAQNFGYTVLEEGVVNDQPVLFLLRPRR
jgi:RimJ/RimL family protein N-acetyltransferase